MQSAGVTLRSGPGSAAHDRGDDGPAPPNLPERLRMTSPDTLATSTSQATDIVVEGRELTKIYGSGDAEVRALRRRLDRLPARPVHGYDGPVRLRQVDDDAHPRRPRHADQRVVLIEGQDITAASDSELTLIRRGKVGFIFQFFNLLPMLTAEENMELPLRLAGIDVDKAWERQAGRVDRARQPAPPPARGAVRRPAAARRRRPRAPHAARRSSSPTSRRATSTRRPAPR